MGMIVEFLCWIALIAGIIGWLWCVAIAFMNEEMIWGIAGIFIPLAALIYGLMNIDEAKVAVMLCLIGFGARFLLVFAQFAVA